MFLYALSSGNLIGIYEIKLKIILRLQNKKDLFMSWTKINESFN